MAQRPFRLGVTRDFLGPAGTPTFDDIGLEELTAAGITWDYLPENVPDVRPDLVRDCDALLVLAPRVSAATLAGNDRLLLVARFGVGYDNVDVAACTANDVLVTITPDGVRRPVAVAALTLLLALSHKLLIKDRLTRAGRWTEKLNHMGQGLTGRTLGVVGVGNVGSELFRLAAPFGMRHVGCDPLLRPTDRAGDGIEWLGLEELLRVADYVCLCCALTPQTHHLLNTGRLALMKPTAYLINVARGPVVDQAALTAVLQAGRLAGAGLDVFEQEPIDARDPLLELDNVIVSPHGLCWTDECFTGIGRSACAAILDAAAGRVPRHVVNREVLDRPGLRRKLALR